MVYGPQGTWSQHLDDGPWTVEELLEPFAGWRGAYLNWREDCWPADVEHSLIEVSRRDRVPLLGCYVQVSDFGYVVALLPGAVVARYVVNPEGTQGWIEGGWALEQCATHQGAGWRRAGLAAWRAGRGWRPGPLRWTSWSHCSPPSTCFPSIRCSATCRLRSASGRRPSLRPGRTWRGADRLQDETPRWPGAEDAGVGGAAAAGPWGVRLASPPAWAACPS